MNVQRCVLAGMLLFSPAASLAQVKWTGTVTDSAGIAIVSNPAEGMWSGNAQWTVEEELRIGTIDGAPEYQFGQIGWIATASDGRVFVLDMQAQEIRVYLSDGRYERTIGRPGQGPGELNGAMFLFSGSGGILTVPDVQNQRINRFSLDGTALPSFPLSLGNGLPLTFRSTSSGTIAQQVRLTDRGLDAITLLPNNGTSPDTLLRFPSGRTIELRDGIPVLHVYSPEPVWTIKDDLSVLYGMNDQYNITEFRRDGSIKRIITLPFGQREVGDRDRSAVLAFLEQRWLEGGVPLVAMAQLRDNVFFGERLPAFANIEVGPGETIWVQHFQPAAALSDEELEQFNLLEDYGAPQWDVFDAAGRFLGVVTMPRRFTPRLFEDDKIYGVWRDELDVQYVIRLRINASAGRSGDS